METVNTDSVYCSESETYCMAKQEEERTSELYERLERVRSRIKVGKEIISKYAFSKRLGMTPGQYDGLRNTSRVTVLQEIALQAMELDGIDWIKPRSPED